MSSLPQRKKSAEEIAQLRDSLGVPEIPDSSLAPKKTATEKTATEPTLEPEPIVEASQPKPEPKLVRSFKKSERAPVADIQQPVNRHKLPELNRGVSIPAQRRTAEELEDMRKRQALSMLDAPAPNPKLAKAHALTIAPGYISAAAGASCFIIEDFPLTATIGCSVLALTIALFIFLRRPISRHHAGFIAIIALFASVFSLLHFFPQLKYAS